MWAHPCVGPGEPRAQCQEHTGFLPSMGRAAPGLLLRSSTGPRVDGQDTRDLYRAEKKWNEQDQAATRQKEPTTAQPLTPCEPSNLRDLLIAMTAVQRSTPLLMFKTKSPETERSHQKQTRQPSMHHLFTANPALTTGNDEDEKIHPLPPSLTRFFHHRGGHGKTRKRRNKNKIK